jgi:hypothetical protein
MNNMDKPKPSLSQPSFMFRTLATDATTKDRYTSPHSEHLFTTVSTVWHVEKNLLVFKVKPQKWVRALLHHVCQMLEISDRRFIKSKNLPAKVRRQGHNRIRKSLA